MESDFIQKIISEHVKKIYVTQEEIINECLSEHFKLPLNEETYKRVTLMTFENEPNVRRYYLDSANLLNFNDANPANFIAMFDNNQDDFSFNTNNEQPKYSVKFHFKTAYINSRFLK